MEPYGDDIYTEPDADPDTLANLGPLRPMAGVWESVQGADDHPVGPGSDADEAEVIAAARARRLRRALRAPADRPADQRPAAALRAALPRAHREAGRGRDVPRPGRLLAVGAGDAHRHAHARDPARPGRARRRARPSPTPRSSRSRPRVGSETYGILSNPFLDAAFRTLSFRIRVTVQRDGTWSYEEDTVMQLPDRDRAVPSHRPQHAHAASHRRRRTRSPTAAMTHRRPPRRHARAHQDRLARQPPQLQLRAALRPGQHAPRTAARVERRPRARRAPASAPTRTRTWRSSPGCSKAGSSTTTPKATTASCIPGSRNA